MKRSHVIWFAAIIAGFLAFLSACEKIPQDESTPPPANTPPESEITADEPSELPKSYEQTQIVPAASLTEEQAAATAVLDAKYERGNLPRVYISTDIPVENLASGCFLTVAEENPDEDALLAVDGDAGTSWHSPAGEEQSFSIDLGDAREVGYIELLWGLDAGVRYEVSVSVDCEKWTTVKQEENGYRNKQDGIEFDAIPIRYIRVDIHEGNHGERGYEIVDFFVMTKKAQTSARKTITTGNYENVRIAVVDREGGEFHTVEEVAGIRVRGNSTATSDKKPYNVKFTEKQNLLGIKGSRKWCLLANHFDKTLIRNKIAYDFCRTAGVPCYLESVMVEVWLDGSYKGLYQLTEPVSDAKTSVDIDPERGEYLLERCGYNNTEVKWNHSPIYGIRFEMKTPEEYTDADRQVVAAVLKRADEAAKSKDFQAISAVFDLDSFVSFYICEELLKDVDMQHGSTYYYIKGGKICSGPMWDMDLSMGNVSVTYGNSDEKYRRYWNVSNFHGSSIGNGSDDSTQWTWAQVDWYAPLMKCPEFAALVVDKYRELQPAIRDLYEDGGAIDRLIDDCGGACLRDYTDYGTRLDTRYCAFEYDGTFETYDEAVKYLKDWLRARNDWLCRYFGID